MSRKVEKSTVFLLCLVPLAWLFWQVLSQQVGPDPAKVVMHQTGEWSLRILAICLAATPMQRFFRWGLLLRRRRMLGLFAFFYALLHLLVFAQVYIGWSVQWLWEEVVERPYITVGALSLLLMLPLAITSTRASQRRLKKNWKRLHRLVYPAAILACVHLLWQARSDLGEALIYCVVIAALLILRRR